MKKLRYILMAALAFALIGCSNPSNTSDNKSDDKNDTPAKTTFVQGWYKYTVSVQGTTQNYYLCYDANKTLTRAGSDSVEFTGVVFDNYKNNDGFSFDTLSKASNESSFKKISDSELPSWATQNNTSNNEETYLTELGNFLQSFSSGTNNQGDTVTFTNISTNVLKDTNNEPYLTCSISATCNYQNAQNLFYTTNSSIIYTNARVFFDYKSDTNLRFILDISNTKNKSEVTNVYPIIYLKYDNTNNTDLTFGKYQTENSGIGYHYTK